jgi:hypothetical protein
LESISGLLKSLQFRAQARETMIGNILVGTKHSSKFLVENVGKTSIKNMNRIGILRKHKLEKTAKMTLKIPPCVKYEYAQCIIKVRKLFACFTVKCIPRLILSRDKVMG